MEYSGPAGELPAPRSLATRLEGGVLTVTLNRPDHGNRMDVALALEMEKLLRTVAADPNNVRVVVLRGAGDCFSAGLDREDFAGVGRHGEGVLRTARAADEAWRTRLLRVLPQPVIAVVHGLCAGEACTVLESCDIVLAADEAQFALPQEDAGVTSGTVAKAAARVMAQRPARYYALTGRHFDGREAERNGLATRSVPAASLDAEAQSLAADLAAKDALAVQFTKETLLHVEAMSWDGVLSFTAAKFAELKALQAGRPSARAAAVESFLAGKSKPGLGS